MLDRDGGLPERWRLVAVETRPAPDDLPDRISWQRFHPVGVTGLLVANELLDNVPLDVVEVDATGVPRLVEVDPATGAERIADRPDTEQSAWLERWWPLAGAETGRRAELGASRDAVWADAVSALRHGVAVAVDYGHDLRHRPAHGTLAGYLNGRQLPPVPDGSMDITAHVAMDAVAAAGEHAGADRTLRLSQRDALRRLGVSGARPPLTLASTDPTGYLRALTTAGGAAELIDPAGLGAFDWLVQSRDAPPDATEPLCQRTDTG
jgi:SAM-dependent MidA family methyltransferase